MYKLRPYQQEAVDKTLDYFRKQRDPALIVLPTGAGKSLVIAEIAGVAQGRVLVLAHVKELVEQNHAKLGSYGEKAGIYSAGLNRKDFNSKVTFGSIQSVARASDDFFKSFSILIIDECHRVSLDENSQYFKVMKKLKKTNPNLCILGLTATPYRLGMGWIYEYNHRGILYSNEKKFFKKCIYDLPLSYMIKNKYLTPPIKIDAPIACYDFSSLKLKTDSGKYSLTDIQNVLTEQKRVTPGIIKHIVNEAKDRKGVMIFTSSVSHAEEILQLLPKEESAIIVGETIDAERDQIILDFKERKLKFLVNVSVLTTGFDAPHVDLIAILRPTESVSLYQQIVGRGLRLSPGKKDCIVLDYTGQDHNIFKPEIGEKKPTEDSEVVYIPCPSCGFINHFWGRVDKAGNIEEHYGRMCKGAFEDPVTFEVEPCSYRFRFKTCNSCGAENDIAARQCNECKNILVDNDEKLKKAMELKDAHVMRVDTMLMDKTYDKKKNERLEIRYYDLDGEFLREFYYLDTPSRRKAFYYNFIRMHNKLPGTEIEISCIEDVFEKQHLFRLPLFVIARKKKYFWEIREKIF